MPRGKRLIVPNCPHHIVQRGHDRKAEEGKAEIFNFIEMFYNPIKRHSHTGGVSPV